MIIRDIWRSQPELCLRALKEFLNILQGQSPAKLKNEPTETTGEVEGWREGERRRECEAEGRKGERRWREGERGGGGEGER